MRALNYSFDFNQLRNQLEEEVINPGSIFHNSDHLLWTILRKAVKNSIFGIWIALLLFILVVIIAHPKCETMPQRSWWQHALIYRLKLDNVCPSSNGTCFTSNSLITIFNNI